LKKSNDSLNKAKSRLIRQICSQNPDSSSADLWKKRIGELRSIAAESNVTAQIINEAETALI
jgi:hypothetical protein